MPTLGENVEQKPIKLLVVGNSGAGKTALLATLAKTRKLFIADFDNGTDILLDKKVLDPALRANVQIKTFYDKNILAGGKFIPEAQGMSNFVSAINDWKEDGKSLGSIYSWGPDVVFALDSLTFLGNACMNHVMSLDGKAGRKPEIQHFGSAVDMQETVIETLYNPAVKCNVVVTAHLIPQADDMQGGLVKFMPSALGKKLPPKIARYFNNVVLVEKRGSGQQTKIVLHTVSTSHVDLKTAKPSEVPAVMEPPDLDRLFTILRGAPA